MRGRIALRNLSRNTIRAFRSTFRTKSLITDHRSLISSPPIAAWAEDVELGYRLRNVGAHFVFAPAADVRHYASRTFSAWRRTPYQYGRYDVIMSRDKGHEALTRALGEFRRRHPANRALSRLVAGRPWLIQSMVLLLGLTVRAATLVGARHAASRALSGIFNLLYWQGVCDELGGRKALWRSVAAGVLSTT